MEVALVSEKLDIISLSWVKKKMLDSLRGWSPYLKASTGLYTDYLARPFHCSVVTRICGTCLYQKWIGFWKK